MLICSIVSDSSNYADVTRMDLYELLFSRVSWAMSVEFECVVINQDG